MMSSLITFTLTSMTIYVPPPRVFLMHRISPTTTLLLKCSMIWKLQPIMLMNVGQISLRDILSVLFWGGQICWSVIWRWVSPVYFGFTIWHNFLGCGCLFFQRWFDKTSLSFDKQNLPGNVIQNKAWKDDVSYNTGCQWTRSRSSWRLRPDYAVQTCTSLGLASLDIGGG